MRKLRKLPFLCKYLSRVALVKLIKPFNYPFIVVPFVPFSLSNILDSPMPFIVGMCKQTAVPADIQLFDVDSGKVID